MKFFFICLTFLAGILNASGQKQSFQDSMQILTIIDNWNKAWQTKDYDLADKDYSHDAHFTNAFGDKRNGQKEVEALLKEVFSLPFVMAGHSETTEHRLQTLDTTTVIVHTDVIRKGQQMPDGSVLPDRQTTHMRVFQKTNTNWKIKAHLISDAIDKQIPKH